jgi:hypothetical protein
LFKPAAMTSFAKAPTVRLSPHPSTPFEALDFIDVSVACAHPQLRLDYHLVGRISELDIPAPEEPVRTLGLWEETCCEAFLKPAGGNSYYEFNLSPSSQWAVFDFTDYRENFRQLDVGRAPVIDCEESADGLRLSAVIDLSMLPPAVHQQDWALGLTCVVKGAEGSTSYWALAHPPEKPDFHDSNCFTLTLEAASRS